jgi:hypothetical protein
LALTFRFHWRIKRGGGGRYFNSKLRKPGSSVNVWRPRDQQLKQLISNVSGIESGPLVVNWDNQLYIGPAYMVKLRWALFWDFYSGLMKQSRVIYFTNFSSEMTARLNMYKGAQQYSFRDLRTCIWL